MSLRAVARGLQRAPGTVSREYRRGWVGNSYDAVTGWETVWARRRRGTRKLVAGRLRLEHPEDQSQQASHETIYQYIYAPRVRQLISQLIDIANSYFKTLHYNSVSC